jgi:hypothetical protein
VLLQVMGELGIGKQQQQQPSSAARTSNIEQPSPQQLDGKEHPVLPGVAPAAATPGAASDSDATAGQAAAAAAAVEEEEDADEEFAAMMADMQGLVLHAEQQAAGAGGAGCGGDGGSGCVSREISEEYGDDDAGNTHAMVSTLG